MKLLFTFLFLLGSQLVSAEQSLEICPNDTGLVGFCNSNGEVVIKHKYYDAHEFRNGHAAVLTDENWAIIDTRGDVVSKMPYDDVYEVINALDGYVVGIDDKWQIISSTGEEKTDTYFTDDPRTSFLLNGAVSELSLDSWLAVSRKGKWEVVDFNGDTKVSFDYSWARLVQDKGQTLGVITKKKKFFAWNSPDMLYSSGHIFTEYYGESEDYLFSRKMNRL